MTSNNDSRHPQVMNMSHSSVRMIVNPYHLLLAILTAHILFGLLLWPRGYNNATPKPADNDTASKDEGVPANDDAGSVTSKGRDSSSTTMSDSLFTTFSGPKGSHVAVNHPRKARKNLAQKAASSITKLSTPLKKIGSPVSSPFKKLSSPFRKTKKDSPTTTPKKDSPMTTAETLTPSKAGVEIQFDPPPKNELPTPSMSPITVASNFSRPPPSPTTYGVVGGGQRVERGIVELADTGEVVGNKFEQLGNRLIQALSGTIAKTGNANSGIDRFTTNIAFLALLMSLICSLFMILYTKDPSYFAITLLTAGLLRFPDKWVHFITSSPKDSKTAPEEDDRPGRGLFDCRAQY